MIDTAWLDGRIDATVRRGLFPQRFGPSPTPDYARDMYLAQGWAAEHKRTQDSIKSGIPVRRLKNGDYIYAPTEWAIPAEILERYKKKTG